MKDSSGKKNVVPSLNLFPVVGVGASAGGLDAFKRLVSAIPENSGMAYVLVQHLDPSHDSLLSQLLQRGTTIPVVEISDDVKVEPNHIYIIPSNKMLLANDGVLEISPRPAKSKNERNLPIDLFFTSLAEVHQSHAIGVVLSGTASDGTQGLKAIKNQGGITFAQDETTAAYPEMPYHAAQAGVVDFILSPEEIPKKIAEIIARISAHDSQETKESEDDDIFKQILSLLHVRKGIDFTYYKQTTIRRRIVRRMVISKYESLQPYLHYLRENKTEQDFLYQDLLIPVTSFFRDPETFKHLCESVFPQLLKSRDASETIRVWIAGCSTGEEAYSMAMCFREYLADHFSIVNQSLDQKVQIFATDISEPAITKARIGLYSKSDIEGVSAQRLKTFFTKSNGGYMVNKQLREMCVFARHNFLKDPPFSKMDLISCRNVLIYMEPYLQKKALTTFHYALIPKRFLLLGKSETCSSVPELFVVLDKADKLFARKDAPGKFIHTVIQPGDQTFRDTDAYLSTESLSTDFQKTADEILLSRYTPAGVVINEAMDIVHFRGKTGDYLEQLPGKPSHNLMKMAKSGLAFELRNILHKAKKNKGAAVKENIPVEVNGSQRTINIEAIPLSNIIEPHYLILFHDKGVVSNDPVTVVDHSLSNGNPKSSIANSKTSELRIQQLEKELAQIREDMRGITEDQEAANEELQSANEELLSSSEELQSVNEELETSKEELQATIEELTVVNQEMITLNEQVAAARDYSETIVATIREPLVVLDHHLRIKSANPSFYTTFQVSEGETEGKSIYEVAASQWDIPSLREMLEKILPEKESFFDFEVSHHLPGMGHRTMLLNGREMKGEHAAERLILLAIEDISERTSSQQKEKELLDELKESELHFRLMADLMPAKISNARSDGQVTYFSKDWLDFAGMNFEDLRDFGYHKIMHPDEVAEFQKRLQVAAETGTVLEMEMRFMNTAGKYIWHLNRASPVKDENGNIKLWVGVTTDISDQIKTRNANLQNYEINSKILEDRVVQRTVELSAANESLEKKNEELEVKNQQLHSFTHVSSHDLQEPLRKIQTFTNLLLDRESQNLSDKGQKYFRTIQDAAKRMQTLIQDLLSFAYLSNGEKKFELIDLNEILLEVMDELKETIEEKNAFIEVKELCSAFIIPFQFRQVLLNLISNSLKFSAAGIPPHITIESQNITTSKENDKRLKPGREYCHIKVTDNGIGFESEYEEKIFEVFQRLHTKDTYAGTGIGLSIVKKVIENHNGFIFASSEHGKGATFDIYIPVEQVDVK